MIVSEKDFFKKKWKQKCGDSLKIIGDYYKEHIDKKRGKIKIHLYKAVFVKYPYEVICYKKHILNGSVVNPEIEKAEFINKIWQQNCGDSLKILQKSEKKDYWKCTFLKYPCEVKAQKTNIIKGAVLNPKIEENEFIGKEYLQNCGDTLIVLEKTNEKKGTNCLYKCEFKNTPSIAYAEKAHILKGSVLNTKIEEENFINKLWKQNCGDILKIKDKTFNKEQNCYLWNVEFINYPYKTSCLKTNIIRGVVDNPNLPWRTKEGLLSAIKNLQNPTLNDLSNYFKINVTTIGKNIREFGLEKYINYWQSKGESELKTFISDLLNEQVNSYNDANFELDIYSSNLNFGVEYNGNYWHSSLYKNSNYHQEKSLYFKEKEISLMHIFEYEWNEKQKILKSLIKSKLGISQKKVGARHCKIKQLDYQTYAKFCNDNHLQGEAGAKVKLGLYFEEELIQIMSFGKPRFSDKFEWEIIRECSKLDYYILGGKEKLWSYFIKNWSPSNCLSYCDFSKFTGDSYLKIGFKKERLNKPGFVWWDKNTNETYWRDPYKNQEMKAKGYSKIYDCGQLVFSWYSK